MSIFDRLLSPPPEQEKIKTENESYDLVFSIIEENKELIDMSSHVKYSDPFSDIQYENIYKFTVKLLSIDFLNKISKDRRVQNVYFSARHSHPGGATDSISLRQRVMVEYY